MSPKVIIYGINRSGTKIASYKIASACKLRKVCLEPFYWDGGVDAFLSDDWQPQIAMRKLSKSGHKEHKKLPVYADDSIGSHWLADLLLQKNWDLVKFVEIGRAKLCQAMSPKALNIGLIREPVGQFSSLNGSIVQKNYVAQQWYRMAKKEKFIDPLPNAEKWLPADLAACAKLYHILYPKLKSDLNHNSIFLSFAEVTKENGWLKQVGEKLALAEVSSKEMPRIGVSTKKELTSDQQKYLLDSLMPIYQEFLSNG